MKSHILALLFLFVTAQNPSQEGRIEGRVLRTGTGEPLANMPVTLISSSGLSDVALASLLDQMAQQVTIGLQGGGGGGSQDLTIQRVTSLLQAAGPGVGTQASMLTDRAGQFAFSNLPRGRYTLWVQRFNFFGPLFNGIPSSTGSFTLSLDPAKALPPVDLFMTQGMAITGRVLDARGQPASLGLPVVAYRAIYSDGKLQWAAVLQRPIDDRGEYRLSPLPPGDYYVGVTPPQGLSQAGQNPSVRTFFPGVAEPAEATRITLKSSDVPGVDFTLRTAPAAFFKISGFAVNPSPGPSPAGIVDNGFTTFVLMPLDSHLIDSFTPNTYTNAVPALNRAAGEFEIRNVRPGAYELYPVFSSPGSFAGRTIVDLRNSDAPGIRVFANPTVSLQGRVVLVEANPQRLVKLDSLRIALKALNAPPARAGGPPLVPVSESGQFSVAGPAGVQATLQVIGVPETAFVADIRLGANSVFYTGFELPSFPEPLQVVIDASSGGTVDTTVRTADNRPAARTMVVLVPSDERRQNPMAYKTGLTDNEGRLVVRGVAPGSYTAFAWESILETAWLNKDFVSKFQDQGTAVVIAPGAQVNLQLKWIPFDSDLR